MFSLSLLNLVAFCWTKSRSCPVPDFFGLSQESLNGFAVSLGESRLQAQWLRCSFAFFWKLLNTVVLSLHTSMQNYLCVNRVANLTLIADNFTISWCDISCLNGSQASCAYFSLFIGKGSLCGCMKFRDHGYLMLSDWVNCPVSPWDVLSWCCYWDDNILCQILLLAVHELIY